MKINKLTDIDHRGTKSYKGRPKKVYLDNRACAFDGHLRVNSYHLKHEQYDGNLSGSIHREVMSRGDAVAVLLLDPYRQEIVLIEQFRVGAWAAGDQDHGLSNVLQASLRTAKKREKWRSEKHSKNRDAVC